MNAQFYRMADLASTKGKAGMIPVTASTIRRWIAEGRFPRPRQLSPGVTVWLKFDVDRWITSHSAPQD